MPHYRRLFFSCLQQAGVFGQYLTRAIRNANDENGKAVSGSYVSAQGQVKQTDVSLSNDHVSCSPVQIQPKDTCLSIRFVMVKHKSNSKTLLFRLSSSPSLTTFLLAQYISSADLHISLIKTVTIGKYSSSPKLQVSMT